MSEVSTPGSGAPQAAPRYGVHVGPRRRPPTGKPRRSRRSRTASDGQGPPEGMLRIQKVLAHAGIASRRAVEEMILQGRVSVNGQIVVKLPCFVAPHDEILVDGVTVRKRPERPVYVLLNKPRGVICTLRDAPGYNRPRATDLVEGIDERIVPVGRLDADATGLIILTNDGELTNLLTHPRYQVGKTYIVRVDGRLTETDVESLRHGVYISGRRASASGIKILSHETEGTLLELKIGEGRTGHVRIMLARLGHKVRRLHRSAIGPLTDRGLKIGNWRKLDDEEVARLLKFASGERGQGRPEHEQD